MKNEEFEYVGAERIYSVPIHCFNSRLRCELEVRLGGEVKAEFQSLTRALYRKAVVDEPGMFSTQLFNFKRSHHAASTVSSAPRNRRKSSSVRCPMLATRKIPVWSLPCPS